MPDGYLLLGINVVILLILWQKLKAYKMHICIYNGIIAVDRYDKLIV